MFHTLLDSAKSKETYFVASGILLTSEIDIPAVIVFDDNTYRRYYTNIQVSLMNQGVRKSSLEALNEESIM